MPPDSERPMTAMAHTGLASSAANLGSRAVAGAETRDGAAHAISWQLPEEVPVALQINSANFAVMMATPLDLRDFAVGFMISEGIIRERAAIGGVLVMPVDNGMAVDVAVESDAIVPGRLSRRALEGRSGCGLCGVEDIAAAVRPLQPLGRAAWTPDAATIARAASMLKANQPMNQLNRSVHGAAWVSRAGDVVLVREDVGRHNALDKLIGALALAKTDLASGFVLMTSRCSFELVQKCVTAGIGALVTVSAPTTLAYDLAVASNLFLAALGPAGPVIFNPAPHGA